MFKMGIISTRLSNINVFGKTISKVKTLKGSGTGVFNPIGVSLRKSLGPSLQGPAWDTKTCPGPPSGLGGPSAALTVDPVDRSDVRHAVFIGFSAFWGGLGQGQGCAGAPPGLPPGLRRPQEVPAGLAAAPLAGLGVEVPLLHHPGGVQREAVAERAAVRELPVGAGRVVLRAWSVRGVQELRGGRVCQGTSAPLAVVIRF